MWTGGGLGACGHPQQRIEKCTICVWKIDFFMKRLKKERSEILAEKIRKICKKKGKVDTCGQRKWGSKTRFSCGRHKWMAPYEKTKPILICLHVQQTAIPLCIFESVLAFRWLHFERDSVGRALLPSVAVSGVHYPHCSPLYQLLT